MEKEFKLSGTVTVSVYTTVKAKSLEEAINIAMEREIERYHWGTSGQEYESWVNEDYDGEVQEIEEIK